MIALNYRRCLHTFLCTLLSAQAMADIVIFDPGLIANSSEANLSQGCVNAMQATITCDPYFQFQVSVDAYSYIPPATLDTVCTTACANSLSSYHNNVKKACAKDPQPWQGTPPELYGDQVWASYNMSCFKDNSGSYCQNVFANFSSPDSDTPMSSLSKTFLCSSCVLKLGQIIQATSYSNYSPKMAKEWAAIQSQCGVTFPTAVQPMVGNRTDIPGYAPSGYQVAQCASGKTYTVVSGDDCGKIATKQSVPRGSLMSINNVLPDCSDLQVGQKLCLPDTCSLYAVKSGDSCSSIANTSNITITQLQAWNPFINSFCSNLLAGDSVCVSQPGPVWTGTTIAGATVTKTAVYATATVAPPGILAHGTSTKCGKYYNVQTGDNCYLIALNFTISIDLFEAINPDINSDCTNLIPGLNYCVSPTADWNSTDTNTTITATYVSAPAPTTSGTTSNCYKWYVIQSGDYCAKVTSAYGITMAQLKQWNPDLKDDCSNLQLGDAYCVQGDVTKRRF